MVENTDQNIANNIVGAPNQKLKDYIRDSIKGAKNRDARNNQSVHEGLEAGSDWRLKNCGQEDLSIDLED